MPNPDGVSGLRLADFLGDLRDELDEARSRAEHGPLQLEVTEIAVSLDVEVTFERRREASVGLRAQFWVLTGKADVKGSASSERASSQHLTLTLKPRLDEVMVDADGHSHVVPRGLDVVGSFAPDEELPDLPPPEQEER